MTEQELQAIRERVNKSTPFEWIAEGLGSEGYTIRVNVRGGLQAIYDAIGFSGNIGEIRAGRDWKELRANAEFVAHSHQDVPKLLDEIEQLQKEIIELNQELSSGYDER